MGFQKAENPNKLLEAMGQHELILAKLYRTYAEKFTIDAVFWNELSQDESKHARCLKQLQTSLGEDPDIIIVQRFSFDAIQSSIRYINELIERTTSPEFEPINAFSLAMKLEEALLEKNYFEVLAGDSKEIEDTLLLLMHETEQHIERLKKALENYKASR